MVTGQAVEELTVSPMPLVLDRRSTQEKACPPLAGHRPEFLTRWSWVVPDPRHRTCVFRIPTTARIARKETDKSGTSRKHEPTLADTSELART